MILVIILYFLFASTFTLGKAALSYVSPFLFIGIRMVSAGMVLLLYYYFYAKESLYIKYADRIQFLKIIVFHIFCAYTLEYWALDYVPSAKACLLYNLSPFITALISYFLMREKLSYRQIIGLLVGFSAFIPILIAHTPLELNGWRLSFISCYELALIISVIASAYGWIVMKDLIHKGYSFIMINGIGMMGGGLLALILSLFKEGLPILKKTEVVSPMLARHYGSFSESIIMLCIYSLALILIANIICYNLYAYLLKRYSPTFLSFAGFMTPLFAALLGWICLGETITWHFFVTIGFVIVGLCLFHEKREIEFEEKGL